MQETVTKSHEPVYCKVCNKELGKGGFTSSTGEVVCSDECKASYTEDYKRAPKLTVYSRVTGYCTPISSWNKGKMREFKDRARYNL